MLTVETRHAIDPATARGFDTDALRAHFHVGGIFRDGEIRLIYTHYDRMIVGGAVPSGAPLVLDRVAEAGTPSILDRREMVVVNIGGDGVVLAAGADHAMLKGDMLYLGMGSGPVTFAGQGRFYILSAPAHATHPTRLIRIAEAATVTLGAAETSNARTIYQFVHPDVMTACQLVVGLTRLYTFSPARMIMSFARSTRSRKPSESSRPMSPVRNQPSAVTASAVASGRFQ
jgi:4-deoxy-L-threo-5-hexosulose-uronate ketol-isomerase